METPAHQYSLLKPPAWLERLTGRSLAVGAVAAFVPFGLLLAMERFFPAYAVQFLYTGMALSALLGIFRVAYFWRHRRHTEFDKDLQNIIICAAGGADDDVLEVLVELGVPPVSPEVGHPEYAEQGAERHSRVQELDSVGGEEAFHGQQQPERHECRHGAHREGAAGQAF